MEKAWKPSRSHHPERPRETITALAKRYHSCAVALSRTLDIPVTDVLKHYAAAVSTLFIEASRQEIRLLASIRLPPLHAPTATAEPSAATNGHASPSPLKGEGRLTQDQARALKALAQQVFSYEAGERRLRHDLGFEADEKLTLRHLAAHVPMEG